MSFDLTNSTEKVVTIVILSPDHHSSKSFKVNHSTKLGEVFEYYSRENTAQPKQLRYIGNNGAMYISPDWEVRSILPRLSATRVAINSELFSPQDI
jgi:hypothetical protein